MARERHEENVEDNVKVISLVKDHEVVVWDYREPWLQQVHSQLEKYMNLPRGKKKAHKEFAGKLMHLVRNALIEQKNFSEAHTKASKDTATEKDKQHFQQISQTRQQLLQNRKDPIQIIRNMLKEKKGLSQKGFNRKTSWLYSFCDSAEQQYKPFLAVELMKKESDRKALISLQDELVKLERSLTAEQAKYNALEEEQRVQKQAAHNIKQDLEKQHAEETQRIRNELTGRLQDSEKVIAERQAQILAVESSLESVRANLAGASLAQSALKTKQEEVDYYRKEYQQQVEILASRDQQIVNLNTELVKTRTELSNLRKLYDGLKTWVDNIFGGVLGFFVSDFFEKDIPAPVIPESHNKIIREIAHSALPKDRVYDSKAEIPPPAVPTELAYKAKVFLEEEDRKKGTLEGRLETGIQNTAKQVGASLTKAVNALPTATGAFDAMKGTLSALPYFTNKPPGS